MRARMKPAHRAVAIVPRYLRAALAASAGLVWCGQALAAASCAAERDAPLVPKDKALCASLEQVVRRPMRCRSTRMRTSSPTFSAISAIATRRPAGRATSACATPARSSASFQNGKWTGNYHGTHAPVVIWYSPDMIAWLKANRPEGHAAASTEPRRCPTARSWSRRCTRRPSRLAPTSMDAALPLNGGAIMVRDAGASFDGWFWGWFGWSEDSWAPDLAGARGQSLSEHGLRPLLHELP